MNITQAKGQLTPRQEGLLRVRRHSAPPNHSLCDRGNFAPAPDAARLPVNKWGVVPWPTGTLPNLPHQYADGL